MSDERTAEQTHESEQLDRAFIEEQRAHDEAINPVAALAVNFDRRTYRALDLDDWRSLISVARRMMSDGSGKRVASIDAVRESLRWLVEEQLAEKTAIDGLAYWRRLPNAYGKS